MERQVCRRVSYVALAQGADFILCSLGFLAGDDLTWTRDPISQTCVKRLATNFNVPLLIRQLLSKHNSRPIAASSLAAIRCHKCEQMSTCGLMFPCGFPYA